MYQQILVKIPNMKHYKNCVVGIMFHMDGRMDGQAYITKLLVTVDKHFADMPKRRHTAVWHCNMGVICLMVTTVVIVILALSGLF